MGAQQREFNAWEQMMALQGQNAVPQSAAQLFEQSTQFPLGEIPPEEMLPSPMMAPPPPPPEPVVQPPVRRTAQPTTQALGDVAQEMVPEPLGPSPVRKLSLREEIELAHQNYGQGLTMQQAEVDKLKEGLSKYTQESRGIDFTPLAAMLDTWYGGNLTSAAKAVAPESAAQKSKNISDMQARIAEAQKGMSASELAGLQQRLAQMGYEEQRKMQREIAQINAGARRSGLMQDRLIEQKAKRLDDDVQKLEKRVGDMPPSIAAKLTEINRLVPGGIHGDVKSGDIPGVGVGQMLVPDFALSDEGSAVQNAARGLMADLIFLRSGAAATDREVVRRMQEYGLSPGSKESTFRTGLRRLQKEITAQLKNKEAGFRPEVRDAYKMQGGVTHEDIQAIGTESTGGGDDDLGADLDKMSPDELKAWLKKHGGGG